MSIQKSLKKAQHATFVSIFIYLLVAALKLLVGFIMQSSAIRADGFNNVTDVMASVAIFVGLYIANLPADQEHQYGHWKAESLASLSASFIMFYIGIQVLISAFSSIFFEEYQFLNYELVYTALISSVIFFGLFVYNKKVAKQTRSIGLKATAKNNLTDAITSFLTGISIVLGNTLHWLWIDGFMAFCISLVILHTGWSIFKENIFQLSDGFDETTLSDYREIILSHPEVHHIRSLKARHYGPNIYVDVTVLMDGNLSVHDSHQVTEDIEHELKNIGVLFTDVHVEPYQKNGV